MAANNVVIATDQNFNSEVLQSKVPVLVDFWAEWCGPCRMIAPTIDELATEFSGKVKVCKLNVDESPGVPGQFGIRGIPTLLLFKDGQAVDQIVGAQGKPAIAALLKKYS